MQRKIIALLMAAMLMTIVGCGNKENNAQAEIEKEEEVSDSETEIIEETLPNLEGTEEGEEEEESIFFSDADLLWTLPKGFKELKGEEGVYVHKSYPKDTSTVTYVISESNTDFSDISKEEFQKLLEDDFYNAYGDEVAINISKYEKSKVNDRTALRIDFEYLFKGTDYLQTEIMIFNGDETHIINYTQEKDGKWSEEFERSIASFSFAE